MRNKVSVLLSLLLALVLLTCCAVPALPAPAETAPENGGLTVVTLPPDAEPEDAVQQAPETGKTADSTLSPPPMELPAETTPDVSPDETPAPAEEKVTSTEVTEEGEYTSPEDVADYLHLYGHLPQNYITKREAQELGWPGGDLWKYAPGKSIGGDRFGNYEGLLPRGRYRECDVNYSGGSRGAERIIYGDDGSIWYTDDHYESFTQLY